MLKSKLRKLVPFRKRRQANTSGGKMGNCAGSSTKEGRGESGTLKEAAVASAEGSKYAHGELVLKVLVEVNRLSSEDGALRWQPVLESLVPLSVQYIQVGQECKFKLEATGVDGRSFVATIKVPDTKVRKSSKNFVQWRDEENGGAWGLNFMCESDADNFMKLCSPSSPSPRNVPSFSVPTPAPPVLTKQASPQSDSLPNLQQPPSPSAHTLTPDQSETQELASSAANHEQDSTTNAPTAPHPIISSTPTKPQSHENNGQHQKFLAEEHCAIEDERTNTLASTSVTSCDFPFESSVGSIKSDGCLSSDSESLELYQPSSPFQLQEEFILPDILEETEETEVESTHNAPGNLPEANLDALSHHSSLEDGDIEETVFESEGEFEPDDKSTEVLPMEDFVPPMLPVSPPPGPLLSSETEAAQTTKSTSVPIQSSSPPPDRRRPSLECRYRRSVAGSLEDMPPPLPLAPPPGKLISPRHSKFFDLADISRSSSKGDIDLSQLLFKMNALVPVKKESDHHEEKEPDKNSEDILAMIPPAPEFDDDLDEEESPTITRQRLGSYYLKTFEPPKEFSDSGFQDTDIAAEHAASKMKARNARLSSAPPALGVEEEDEIRHSLIAMVQRIDSPMTCTSDEQLTENSGSVGLKTIASSGSEDENLAFNEEAGRGTEVKTTDMAAVTAEVFHYAKSPSSDSSKSAIRKTGWLEMKAVLVSKNRKVAMKSKRKWKKYWANLKGSILFLYECDEQSTLPALETIHSDVKLDLENSLAHAVNDHVKRDNLFCLSTSSGNTYYMQTASQTDVDDWITCIHCAAAIASTHKDKDNSLPLLQAKMDELNKYIEKENQLKNLTSLNLSAASDSIAKSMATDRLTECSENLEAYKVEQYRIRCYIASLQGTELPNPQSLLGSISKPTKTALGRIGIVTVASLHATVSARNSSHTSSSASLLHLPKASKLKERFTSTLPRSPSGRRARKGSLDISDPFPSISSLSYKMKTSSMPAGLKGSVSLRSFESSPHALTSFPKASPGRSPRGRKFSLDMDPASSSPDRTPGSKRSLGISGPYPLSAQSLASLVAKTQMHNDQDERTVFESEDAVDSDWATPMLNVLSVRIPSAKIAGGQMIQLTLRIDTTAGQLLHTVCKKFKLSVADHFVRLKKLVQDGFKYVIAQKDDILLEQHYTDIEVCQKSLKTVILEHATGEEHTFFGLNLVPEWDAKTEIDLQSVVVEEVRVGSEAERKDIGRGDEVVLINDKSVMELGWVEVEKLMSGEAVRLILRSSVADAPLSNYTTNGIIESLICPAPPVIHPEISGDLIKSLVIPTPPSIANSSIHENGSDITEFSNDQIAHLLKDSNEISKLLRKWESQQMDEVAASTPWTEDDKLRKSVSDLVETESEYVRLLNVLVERYFEPLRHETHLGQHEVESLIGSIVRIVRVQNSFLVDLQEALKLEVEEAEESESLLKEVVLRVADIFLEHVKHFRHYSSFCASRQIVKQILDIGENTALIEFFRVRNPTTNLSLNVDSLLAKPIVRVSRYPLFLSAMLDHTVKGSEESNYLRGAIKAMGVVADHMNEMQRLCETYWPLIHALSNNPRLHEIGVSASITELKHHGDVTWLNPPSLDGLSKGWKKGQGPQATMFVFRSSVVLVCLEKKGKRKEGKAVHEIRVEAEDAKYKQILPTVQCVARSLPDSDGVTNMWRLQYHNSRTPATNFLFRSKSMSEKLLVLELIQESTREQQQIYGSPRPSSAHSRSLTTFDSSPYTHPLRSHRTPTPTSTLAMNTGGRGITRSATPTSTQILNTGRGHRTATPTNTITLDTRHVHGAATPTSYGTASDTDHD